MVNVRRPGLSLVEALVALVLFGAGVLAVAAASSRAVTLLRHAEARDGARTAMLSVADSLAQFASPAGGTKARGRYALAWTVADSGAVAAVVVRITWVDGSAARSDSVRIVAARSPARLHVVP